MGIHAIQRKTSWGECQKYAQEFGSWLRQLPSPTPIRACRVCTSPKLERVISLGNQYVSDFVTEGQIAQQAPLDIVRCLDCGLIQLLHTFPRGSLYQHYWYKSGISVMMRNALADVASKTCDIANPGEGDLVLDIGCNDGTLLRSYNIAGLLLVGFEPAQNLVDDARKGTAWVFNDFFSGDIFKRRFGEKKAKIISSVAMFYDLEDPNSFVSDVADILAVDGVFVVQQNYLGTMLEQNGFDNIGHEHLEYYSLRTLQTLLSRHGLEVFEAETNDVNGGSFRTFVCHKGSYKVGSSVEEMKQSEAKLGLDRIDCYQSFAQNISRLKSHVHEFVRDAVRRGQTVYVYGASNRGNTILQYFELDRTLIPKATDANPEKWGKKTAGTLIPIVSKEEARRDNPDYFLILPHHFLVEIEREEKSYLESGGKFIVPLPEFRVVGKS